MEEAKAKEQQQLLLHHHHQQQQQQLFLMQQKQQLHQQQLHQQQQQQQQLHQQQQQQLHQQQQQQQQAMARFPSNIDAHLRPPGLIHRPIGVQQHHQNPSPNPTPLPTPTPTSTPNPNPNSSPILAQQTQTPPPQQQQQNPSPVQSQQQAMQQQQQKLVRPGNQAELQMAYQDAWRVCHPDFKRPFASLEDACERLLPYHVVADYEAEEDDRILDSDTTGNVPSRSQQWDHNIALKVAEFTATFEKQALAFNLITRKRTQGEFRSEERLMVEQALLQDERRALMELRTEIETREKASREAHEAKLRMAAVAQAEQAQAESQARAEVMARAPIRASVLESQMAAEQEDPGVDPEEMMNGWGNNGQRDEKEPSDNFLNDEEAENGETGMQDEWRGVGEFDLNTR